jgi:hypothetical protein
MRSVGRKGKRKCLRKRNSKQKIEIKRKKREGAEKPNAFRKKTAPKPPFSWKGKRNTLSHRNSKQKIQIKRKKREGAE